MWNRSTKIVPSGLTSSHPADHRTNFSTVFLRKLRRFCSKTDSNLMFFCHLADLGTVDDNWHYRLALFHPGLCDGVPATCFIQSLKVLEIKGDQPCFTWCSLLKGRQCPDPACHKLVKRNCDFSHSQGLKVKKIHCNFSHSLDTEVREALSIDHLHLHPWSCHRVHHNPLQQNWFRIETVHLCYITLRSRYSEFWIAMQQCQLVERTENKQIESVVESLTMWTAVPMKMQ